MEPSAAVEDTSLVCWSEGDVQAALLRARDEERTWAVAALPSGFAEAPAP